MIYRENIQSLIEEYEVIQTKDYLNWGNERESNNDTNNNDNDFKMNDDMMINDKRIPMNQSSNMRNNKRDKMDLN